MPYSCKQRNVFLFNERGSGLGVRGEVQNYQQLHRQCLQEGTLFEDAQFDKHEYFKFPHQQQGPVTWLRPREIVDDPKFIAGGASRFDVEQGSLGDCWLLAGVAAITMRKELFEVVVPDGQEMDEDNYAGIFHFRFWQYGSWVDVVVDDLLPTIDGRLLFLHSDDNHEFWSALLEKAYAKLHGSYEALDGGQTSVSMEDFSGGLSETYMLGDQAPDNLFQIMQKAEQHGSLMCAAIYATTDEREARISNGLIAGHAYSVTRACAIDTCGEMVRIRNPWGNSSEWKGAFSDTSAEWSEISEEAREQLGLTIDADGEFWMTLSDFVDNFDAVDICNLSPECMCSDEDGSPQCWQACSFSGAWVRGTTAGGCRNDIDSFAHNPQYRLQLVDSDDGDDLCTVIIALMQKPRRKPARAGSENLPIGFELYPLREAGDDQQLDSRYLSSVASVKGTPQFVNRREVTCQLRLPPGAYCLIPSTFEPDQERQFIVRVFSEAASSVQENGEQFQPDHSSDQTPPELEDASEGESDAEQLFAEAAGEGGEMDWRQLQGLLDTTFTEECQLAGFSKDTVRCMVALLDVNGSGRLDLAEFLSLWRSVRLWRAVFRQHDSDGNCLLTARQLRAALAEAGFRVGGSLLSSLVLRYGDEEGKVAFDDFIACAVKMERCIVTFRDKDPDDSHRATVSLADWIRHGIQS